MDFLLWLDQLKAAHEIQVGDRLLYLSQILGAGHPVQPGFVVADGIMQTLWSRIQGPDEILQDFPYLRLNFSLDQAVQVRGIAQTLQQKILDVPADSQWREAWGQGINRLEGGTLILTPYIWTSQTLKQPISARLPLQSLVCDRQGESFWQTLKVLWANLLQAQNLYILQHLGLHPAKVHLSVLVQAWSSQQRAGYLKATPTHFFLQAEDELDQRLTGTEYSVYDRFTKTWMTEKSNPLTQKTVFSDPILQSIVDLGEWLEHESQSLNVAWKIAVNQLDSSVQILGMVSEMPMPVPMPVTMPVTISPSGRSQTQTAFTDASVQTALNARHPLGKGFSAAGRSLAAPVFVVRDFQGISPEQLHGAILVAHHLEPLHLPWLKAAAGLICESGSLTSHGAILARELGLPAIVGVSGILQVLKTGQWIFLDGQQGEIYPYEAKDSPIAQLSHGNSLALESAHQDAPFTTTQIFVQLSQLGSLEVAQSLGADGVGIIRGEWLLRDQLFTFREPLRSPLESSALKTNIEDALINICQAFDPLPAYYRFTDLHPSDRPLWLSEPEESSMGCHPALGLRGTLWHSHDPRLFEMELRILRSLLDRGTKNLSVVLPFVRSPQEIQFCLETMQTIGIDPYHDVSLWMMAEVPSILFTLEDYVQRGIQGIAIGMSDFSQLLLGVDRDHPTFELLLTQNRGAVMSAILQLVQRATALNLSSILCGSVAHYPAKWLEKLLNAGLMGISVEIDAVGLTKQAIAQTEAKLRRQEPLADPTRHYSSQETEIRPLKKSLKKFN